jgi:epoxyqueuosine reductase
MPISTTSRPLWLATWMAAQDLELWGAADLRAFTTPKDTQGHRLPFALSWALPLNRQIMAGIQQGPNRAYAEEYDRVNDQINRFARMLVDELTGRGFRALALAASQRTDKVNIKGDFPHKTAATQAGLGWVGRHCQLITRKFGPWIRLGTVFTDMELPCGPKVTRHFCGSCRRCVEACPARALTGQAWYPGIPREDILGAETCDHWKKTNYFAYHEGHVCGICSAVCPYGLKSITRKVR